MRDERDLTTKKLQKKMRGLGGILRLNKMFSAYSQETQTDRPLGLRQQNVTLHSNCGRKVNGGKSRLFYWFCKDLRTPR